MAKYPPAMPAPDLRQIQTYVLPLTVRAFPVCYNTCKSAQSEDIDVSFIAVEPFSAPRIGSEPIGQALIVARPQRCIGACSDVANSSVQPGASSLRRLSRVRHPAAHRRRRPGHQQRCRTLRSGLAHFFRIALQDAAHGRRREVRARPPHGRRVHRPAHHRDGRLDPARRAAQVDEDPGLDRARCRHRTGHPRRTDRPLLFALGNLDRPRHPGPNHFLCHHRNGGCSPAAPGCRTPTPSSHPACRPARPH